MLQTVITNVTMALSLNTTLTPETTDISTSDFNKQGEMTMNTGELP
jgi:hypothetical protein